MSNSLTSRYERENRRYQRTAQTIISGSKCRHLNSAGRRLIMEYNGSLSDRALSFCNTSSMAGESATPGYENEGRADQDPRSRWRDGRFAYVKASSVQRQTETALRCSARTV
jgi:hypothetical protein